jgi:hypothetical protein
MLTHFNTDARSWVNSYKYNSFLKENKTYLY